MQSKIIVKYYLTPTRMAVIRRESIKSVVKDMEKLELHTLVVGL